MRVYLSGPMTGYPGFNWTAFQAAEQYAVTRGWVVLNPHDTEPEHEGPCTVGTEMQRGHTRECWVAADLIDMVTCDAVLMLDGWAGSRGAQIEWNHATRTGMTIYYMSGQFSLPLMSGAKSGVRRAQHE